MLYAMHEVQRAFLAPFAAMTDAGSQMFSNPYSPFAYTPVSRQIAAVYALMRRLGKHYEKPAWGLHTTHIDGKPVAVSEHAALDKPFCRLLHFQRALPRGTSPDPVVLLVAPMSGHHATLLRDTVRALLPNHDVYVTDWIDARLVPVGEGPFHLNDYVRYVREFLQFLGSNTHVISVCQPTVPVLAAISLMATDDDPCQPRSMTMMGGPIDTRESPTQVNHLATKQSYAWFENSMIYRVPARYPGAGRKVYPGFLQHASFIAMNPDRHWQSHLDFYRDLVRGDDNDAQAHKRFYDEYNAVMDMPAEFYLDTIHMVFQDHQLAKSTWAFEGRRVDPAAIRQVALFTIEGELDDISGQGQTHAAQRLCSQIPPEHKAQYTAPGCGHYGIFSGRRWRETICPKIAQFIRSKDAPAD